MAITFDPATKRVILGSASVSAQEIWSRWADWVASSDNAKYLPALRHVGGDALGGGRLIPHYFFLLNGWRVRPMEASHTLTLTGNLFVEEEGDPIVPTLGNYSVLANLIIPVQAQGFSTSGSSSGPTAGQIADAVWARAMESGMTAEQLFRVMVATLSGRSLGVGGPSESYLSVDGGKVRVQVLFDSQGNRSTVNLDGS